MKRLYICLVAAVCFSALSLAQNTVDISKIKHPRLIANDKEFKQMVLVVDAGRNPMLVKMHDAAISKAKKYVKKGELPKTKAQATDQLTRSRDALSQIFNCAYAFRYSGDYAYLEYAEKVLKYVCELPDWDPDHLLCVGEMMQAVAIGYDWLYKDLDKTVRKQIEEKIQTYGFDVSENERYNIRTFRAKYNWSEVLNAGYAAAAIAIYETDKKRCEAILERSILNYREICSEFYGPEGVYNEGPNYWGYGTSNHILMSSVLQGVYGNDCGVTDIPGFEQTPYFITFMTGATGKFNFSDAWPRMVYNNWLWFFAAKYNNPSLAYECKRLENLISDARLGPLAIYWASKVDAGRIVPPRELMYVGHGKIDVAAARTGWDGNDAYLAIKAGLTRVTHGHMDCGGFIYENDGVRWVREMPVPKYDVNRKGLATLGVKAWHVHTDQRWKLLGYRPIDHNTIVVNGKLHQIDSVASIMRSFDNEREGRGVTVNLTPIYGRDLALAHRTVAIMPDASLQVRDTLAAPDTAAAHIRWNLIAGAHARATDNGIILEKSGKKMFFSVEGFKVDYKIWSVDPADYADDPYMAWQTKPEDTEACGFEFILPRGTCCNLKITLTKSE